jgi:hypothetical protein
MPTTCKLELVLWQRTPLKKGERNDKRVGGFCADLPVDEAPADWAVRI